MVTRIQPAVSDPEAARSIVGLLSQLPDSEPVAPAADSTQLLDSLKRQAEGALSDLDVVRVGQAYAAHLLTGGRLDDRQLAAVRGGPTTAEHQSVPLFRIQETHRTSSVLRDFAFCIWA